MGFFLWVAGASAPASANDAEAVARQVQAFYDQTQSVQADFRQTYFFKLYQRQESSWGRVAFKKPGRMRWDYAQPNGKVIVSDGKMLQLYDPGEAGSGKAREPGQLVEQRLAGHQLPAAFAFLLGSGKLLEDFQVRLLADDAASFPQGKLLELRPKTPQPQYERIVFYVGTGASAGVVHRLLIVDAAGNRNRFDFSKLRFNQRLDDKLFRFQPPKNTRRVAW